MTDPFCTLETIAAQEAIFGTAVSEVTIWFILEYTDPWSPEIELENNLPAPVQTWFRAQLAEIPHSRLQFIKRADVTATASPIRHFYVAVTTPHRQTLHAFTIETYAELLWLDLPGIVADAENYAAYRQEDTPLFLVCTHGKRDKCCAKFGRPVYEALSAVAPEQTWESSHLGGHRYAAVTAVLPFGLYYGLLAPTAVSQLVAATQRHEIFPQHFRGCTHYPPPVQAADYFLRQKLADWRYDQFVAVGQEMLNEEQVRVQFQEKTTAVVHTVTLDLSFSPVMAGCSPPKQKQRPHYHLVDIASGE